MVRMSFLVLPIFIFLIIFPVSNSVEENVKQSLVQFMEKLSSGNGQNNPNWGWNMSSDPCKDIWVGVLCDSQLQTVRGIVLDEFNFDGSLDVSSLCMVDSLAVLSLRKNKISGLIPDEIGNCKSLTHLYLTENRLSGSIPEAISTLSNLKRLDISKNYLSGKIASLSGISSLASFLAQENQLTGKIPDFNFANLQEFNLSNNGLTGPIPDTLARFSAGSFYGNPGLCGYPLSACPPSAAPAPSPCQ
ncbi:probable inactive receptor kinase At2g26730 [Mercurialis annua]|uniref:probable inactive receptor kinase At2g26730 n=1 Tax=Mercurialis annua TaxID=3986 RepID=UPI00215F24CB|nr:probable inactive receptor kinase At2g26730 [Mercurialis annua]